MEADNNNPGYKDRGFGILEGADKKINNDLNIELHLSLSSHKISVHNGHNSELSNVGAYLGTHMFYSTDNMPGYYFSGHMRYGLEDNDIKRYYDANGYSGKVKGKFQNMVLTFGMQIGKEFYSKNDPNLIFGPIGYFNYTFIHRPSFRESGDVFALSYESNNTNSFSTSLGGHIDYRLKIDDNILGLSLLTLWNHDYLSRYTHSKATFADYPTSSFESNTRLPTRDSFLIQGRPD